MPRIPYREDSADLSPLQRKALTRPLNIGKMTAWFPEDMLGPFNLWGAALLQSPALDAHLRELAILRVGHLSRCAYELNQHVQFARQLGLAEDKIAATEHGAGAPVYTRTEQRVLAFVDELVRDVRPTDRALTDVREELTVEEIFCLIAAVGQYMMICRILETTGVELDPEGVVVSPGK
jgi:4-carboxymuconolactone decarboxylase